MRLEQMGKHFIEGRGRSGLGMIVKTENGETTLEYKNGDRIATITDRTAEGFTLTIHPYKGRYGCIAHCNRLSAVFRSLAGTWENRRYSSFQRWGSVQIWDNKLRLEIRLHKDTAFTVRDNIAALDYTSLERACLTDGKEEPKVRANNHATQNSGEAINNLMALVATI